MALQYVISTGSVAMVLGTAKTLIEAPSSSTVPYLVYKMEISCAISSGANLIITWNNYTVSGTGTTVTPLKWGVDQSVAAIMGTVKVANSAEAGAWTVLTTLLIPLPGMYSIIDPFGRETYVPISTLRSLRGTASVAGNVAVNLYVEQ